MAALRYVIKHGLSTQLKESTLYSYELCFNMDTSELMVGTDNGPVKVCDVVVGPNDGLYLKVPEGYMPLCISSTVIGK